MNKKIQYERNKEYILSNGLDKIVDFKENIDYTEGVFDSVDGTINFPIPPEANDLVRLHKILRKTRPFTILEFGVGYSTLIMADALYKNKLEWELYHSDELIRNRFMFKLFSVDTSNDWIAYTEKKIPKHFRDIINLHQSDAYAGIFRGQICHYFEKLPDIVPDFIYLDGPASKEVNGNISGLTFKCQERTVMSADLLLMEPTFLPGLTIVIDGRINNARFLERNFTRKYDIIWDKEGDVTFFTLNEDRLGKYNILGSDFKYDK